MAYSSARSGRQRTLLEPLVQCLAFQVLHHQEVDPIVMANVVQRADVRMAQAGDGLSFALEAFMELRITGEMFGQDFDGDSPVEPRVASAVYLAHAARTNNRNDLVWAQPSRGRERHRSRVVYLNLAKS